MRKIFLIRHGRADLPESESYCIGKTDPPLSRLGAMQAALAGIKLQDEDIKQSYSSKLQRAAQTAKIMRYPNFELPELNELNFGEWDGLSFTEIKSGWPLLYRERAENPFIMPEGAENIEKAQKRMTQAFRRITEGTVGNVAIISHRYAMQLLLSSLLSIELNKAAKLNLPHGSITELNIQENDIYLAKEGRLPHPELSHENCIRLMEAAGASENQKRHGIAVADQCMRIVVTLAACGYYLDEQALYFAAMLHDIARDEKNHAKRGAHYLRTLGYEKTAYIIENHHEDIINLDAQIDERIILQLADKLVIEDRIVTLNERFAESYQKCETQEAKNMHGKRFELAVLAAKKLNEICGKSLIKI